MISRDTQSVLAYYANGGEPPSSIDWNAVVTELKAHAMTPLLGMKNDENWYPPSMKEAVSSLTARQIYRFTKTGLEQQKVTEALAVKGIIPTVIKGFSLAQYYDVPILRTVGDIDLLIETEREFNIAVDELIRLGYRPIRDYDGLTFQDSLKSGSRHLEFGNGDTEIEIHSRYYKKKSAVDEILEKTKPVLCQIGRFSFYSYPHAENGIIILQHIKNHIENNEVGLRLLTDWLFYAKTVVTDAFWEQELSPQLDRCGLKKLAIHLTAICEKRFGLPKHQFTAVADDRLCDRLFELISDSGNFGATHGTVSVRTMILRHPRKALGNLQAKGKREWKAYQRCKYLVPFAWIYGILQSLKIVGRAKNGVSEVMDGFRNIRKVELLIHDLDIRW